VQTLGAASVAAPRHTGWQWSTTALRTDFAHRLQNRDNWATGFRYKINIGCFLLVLAYKASCGTSILPTPGAVRRASFFARSKSLSRYSGLKKVTQKNSVLALTEKNSVY
jgi:hypothetical protein